MGQPYVFPHGVTVYDPQKCWNGYTIVPLINDGVLLFDMNGNEVRRWNMHAMPPKLLPGGYVMGLSGYRHPDYGMQDGVNLMGISSGNLTNLNISTIPEEITAGWHGSTTIIKGKAIRLDIMCREWTQSHWRGIP